MAKLAELRAKAAAQSVPVKPVALLGPASDWEGERIKVDSGPELSECIGHLFSLNQSIELLRRTKDLIDKMLERNSPKYIIPIRLQVDFARLGSDLTEFLMDIQHEYAGDESEGLDGWFKTHPNGEVEVVQGSSG